MKTLEELREQLDSTDKEIMRLFSERMDISKEIGAVKKRDAIPVTNAGREEIVIAQVRACALDSAEKDALEKVYRSVIAASKDLEK